MGDEQKLYMVHLLMLGNAYMCQEIMQSLVSIMAHNCWQVIIRINAELLLTRLVWINLSEISIYNNLHTQNYFENVVC